MLHLDQLECHSIREPVPQQQCLPLRIMSIVVSALIQILDKLPTRILVVQVTNLPIEILQLKHGRAFQLILRIVFIEIDRLQHSEPFVDLEPGQVRVMLQKINDIIHCPEIAASK